jgi:hypothetical protein
MMTSVKATQKAMTNLRRSVHHARSASTTSSAALNGRGLEPLRHSATTRGLAPAEKLEAQAGRFWVDIVVDVFDREEIMAVTYPLPDRLGWEYEEVLLMHPMVGSRRLVGLSVADFVPHKGADGGTHAALSISSPAYLRHDRQRSERLGPFLNLSITRSVGPCAYGAAIVR